MIEWSHYDKLVEYANLLLNKRNRHYLYNGIDVVHQLYATTDNHSSYEYMRKGILDIIQNGVITSCNLSQQEVQPLDEQYCSKCKSLKYVIYDYKPQLIKRFGSEYVYYSRHCRVCHNNGTAAYKQTSKGKAIHKLAAKKYDDQQSMELGDNYIKKLIYNYNKSKGIIRTFDSITALEIHNKRTTILAKRSKVKNG